MNKPYNIQNTNICNGIFHISFFKAQLINEGETTQGETTGISKDKNVMAWTRKYYLKNSYLTLRSKVKVPRRSLQYATHRLMVMHPHTKYN
jgi:hypothetical protein